MSSVINRSIIFIFLFTKVLTHLSKSISSS
nr:MAG TPA: hypothetical protein [Caudoviricetes sp.]